MTIDEAIKHAKEISCKNSKCYQYCANDCSKCEEYHEQLAEWLEELKKLRQNRNKIPIATITFSKKDLQKMVDEKVKDIELDIQEIRNKAIDDFLEKIQWEYLNSCGIKQQEIDFLIAVSDQVAEQLKEGSADNE